MYDVYFNLPATPNKWDLFISDVTRGVGVRIAQNLEGERFVYKTKVVPSGESPDDYEGDKR